VRSATSRKWLKAGLVSAALLGGAGVATIHWMHRGSAAGRPAAAERAPEPVSAWSRLAMAECVKHAFLLYDVHWSAACMVAAQEEQAKHAACLADQAIMADPQRGEPYCDASFPPRDDSIDCDLPNERAAGLDALLRDAEQRCYVPARAG
jgi:hypothetical protein